MPPRRKWKGCPFYYESLKILSEIIREPPPKPEVILLCPIWFNWELRTKFDDQLVQLGFIVIKDLFYNGQLISNDFFNERNIQGRLKQKLTTIINRVPQNWIGTVSRSNVITVTKPASLFSINSIIHHIIYTETRTRYRKLVEHKVCPPIGLLNWCLDFEV